MTLRNRLFTLVGASVSLTVVLVTWTVSSSARNAFAALDAQRAASLIAQFRREFRSEGEQVALRIERIAENDALARTAADLATGRRDFAPYVNDAGPLAAAQGLDFLDIVAPDGTIVSSAHWPARFGYKHSTAGSLARASGASGGFLQIVESAEGSALGLVAVRKVTAGDSGLYLAGGRRLDRQLLESLDLPPGMRALLYRNLDPEGPRQQLIAVSGGDDGQVAQLEPLIARVRRTGQEARETIDWPEGPETVDALPLAGTDGRVLGVLLIGTSGRELAALLDRIRWSGAAFGGLGIVVGFVLSYVVAARVTRPVEQLAEAARDVAGGNWNVRLDAERSSREIDALADAFDSMTSQLVDHRERLVQAERVAAWRDLARRLAHELKNPLFPLRLTLDNLRRAKPLPAAEFDEVFDEGMTTLSTGLANLTSVVARFSDFARMPPPEFGDVSINDIARQSVALFQAQLAAPGAPPIAVTLELDPACGTTRGDAEQIARAMQNLLVNAIDAMPHGGTLAIRTTRAGGAVCIDVSDSGIGMTEEERARVFTPYYTTKTHGTGLGLAIVQSVVADHEGRISIDSVPGRGTTFHLELPAAGAGGARRTERPA